MKKISVLTICIAALIGVLLVSGCIGQTDKTLFVNKNQGPSVKTYSIFINSLPSYANLSYETTLKDAFAYWKDRENVEFNIVTNISKADVVVDWIKEFGGERAGHIVRGDFIQIGLGDSNCLGKWQAYTLDTVKVIATHEIGHSIGRDHSSDIRDVMYPITITKYIKDFEETDFLPQNSIRYYPLCTKRNSTIKYEISINSDNGINIYVVPSKEDFDAIGQSKEFNAYKDCTRAGVTLEKIICNVQQGSAIVLENPRKLISGKDAKFTVKAVEQ